MNKNLQLDPDKAWLVDVRRISSPNCDARPDDTLIDLLVIHGISLPPGEFGGSYIDQLFTNSLNKDEHPYFSGISDLKVSAHVLIDRLGRLTQYVSFNKRAWHAGRSEFQGRSCCNDYSIGIELEGTDEQAYTDEQYQSLLELTKLIRTHWPAVTKDQIVGHCQIAPGRKTDPGPAFDWGYYFKLLDAGAT